METGSLAIVTLNVVSVKSSSDQPFLTSTRREAMNLIQMETPTLNQLASFGYMQGLYQKHKQVGAMVIKLPQDISGALRAAAESLKDATVAAAEMVCYLLKFQSAHIVYRHFSPSHKVTISFAYIGRILPAVNERLRLVSDPLS